MKPGSGAVRYETPDYNCIETFDNKTTQSSTFGPTVADPRASVDQAPGSGGPAGGSACRRVAGLDSSGSKVIPCRVTGCRCTRGSPVGGAPTSSSKEPGARGPRAAAAPDWRAA